MPRWRSRSGRAAAPIETVIVVAGRPRLALRRQQASRSPPPGTVASSAGSGTQSRHIGTSWRFAKGGRPDVVHDRFRFPACHRAPSGRASRSTASCLTLLRRPPAHVRGAGAERASGPMVGSPRHARRRCRGGPRRRSARAQGREATAVSHVELRSRGRGGAPATSRPVFSIDISRELSTVVVRLEGLLDKDSSPVLVELLWDLVVGQGNHSVTVDARRVTLSDPALICVFQVLEREAALRGGTLDVVEPSPPAAPADRNRTAAALDHRRARRAAALGMAVHPAGGGRTTQAGWGTSAT